MKFVCVKNLLEETVDTFVLMLSTVFLAFFTILRSQTLLHISLLVELSSFSVSVQRFLQSSHANVEIVMTEFLDGEISAMHCSFESFGGFPVFCD